jgi:hypothetical protein
LLIIRGRSVIGVDSHKGETWLAEPRQQYEARRRPQTNGMRGVLAAAD